MSASLVLFGGQSEGTVSVANAKTGCRGARLMSAGEFRKAHPEMGKADRSRAYEAYLREKGVLSKQAIAALLTSNDVIVTGAKSWESGKFQISGRRMEQKVDQSAKLAALEAELAAARAKLAQLSMPK